MHLRASKWVAITAVSLVLAGCSGAEPGNAPPPPPPPPEATYNSAPVELAGAPEPPAGQEGLAGAAPARAEAMSPIPNPEDLAPAERRRIYGTAYDDAAQRQSVRPRPLPRAEARPRPAVPRPAAVAKAPARPKPAAVAPLEARLAQLQAALAPQVSTAAVLTVSPALSDGREGAVVLTLPSTVYDTLRREAAKLGLDRAARVSEVNAALTGQGYTITPSSPQTARLKSGEATSFQWQVKPGAGPLAPLHVEIGAALRGQKETIVLPLAPIDRTVAKPKVADATPRGMFNWGNVDVPGVGPMRWETVIGGGLLLLALLLLVAIARNASEAEARARRQRRKAAASAEPEPVVQEPVVQEADRPDTAVAAPDETKAP